MHTVFLYLLGTTARIFDPPKRTQRALIIGEDNTGSNIGLNEKSAMEVPDSEVHKLQQGGIFAFLAWISYICLVWSFKGVLMFLYNRITSVPVRVKPCALLTGRQNWFMAASHDPDHGCLLRVYILGLSDFRSCCLSSNPKELAGQTVCRG